MLPLSKTLDPADYADLTEELTVVDRHFTEDRPQHPQRRFEYALALRAFSSWGGWAGTACVDVGGAGSPFWRMLEVDNVWMIDPETSTTLADYMRGSNPRLFQAVFCLSVLEHVDDLDEFLYHLSCLMAPGGLLFLTVDYQEDDGPDNKHFHWMRKRIFGPSLLESVIETFLTRDFSLFGDSDLTYHGPQVYDYTFASLCFRKRL